MIPVSNVKIWGNELKYLEDCINSGWLSSSGKYVKEFERAFAQYIGCKAAIACNSGTSALYTSLNVLGIGPGDEVIIPNFTIIVSANTVILNGATPILVDVEQDTFCINPKKIELAITEATKAIMVVHMYGHPCNMTEIQRIAQEHGLYIIEDCCHAIGAEYNGKLAGTMSDLAIFSFYANKTITCGEGGLIVSNSEELSEKARLFINNGFTIPRFKHDIVALNFSMSNLHAAVALAQLENVNSAVERKREIASQYLMGLKDCKGIVLPKERKNVKSAYWMFTILLDEAVNLSREEFMLSLKKYGVETRTFYHCMSRQPVFLKNNRPPNYPITQGEFPVSEKISDRGFYIPSGINIREEDIDYCINALCQLCQKYC